MRQPRLPMSVPRSGTASIAPKGLTRLGQGIFDTGDVTAGFKGLANGAMVRKQGDEPGNGFGGAKGADGEEDLALLSAFPFGPEKSQGFGAALGGEGHGGFRAEARVMKKGGHEGQGNDAFALDQSEQALTGDLGCVVAETGLGAQDGVCFQRSDLADGAKDVDAGGDFGIGQGVDEEAERVAGRNGGAFGDGEGGEGAEGSGGVDGAAEGGLHLDVAQAAKEHFWSEMFEGFEGAEDGEFSQALRVRLGEEALSGGEKVGGETVRQAECDDVGRLGGDGVRGVQEGGLEFVDGQRLSVAERVKRIEVRFDG